MLMYGWGQCFTITISSGCMCMVRGSVSQDTISIVCVWLGAVFHKHTFASGCVWLGVVFQKHNFASGCVWLG